MLCHLMILNAHFSLLNAWLKINACTHECVHRKKCCSGWKPSRLLPRRSLRRNGHYGVDSQRWFETMKCIEMSWSSGDPICQPPSTMLAIIWGVNQTVPEAKKLPPCIVVQRAVWLVFQKMLHRRATPRSSRSTVQRLPPCEFRCLWWGSLSTQRRADARIPCDRQFLRSELLVYSCTP